MHPLPSFRQGYQGTVAFSDDQQDSGRRHYLPAAFLRPLCLKQLKVCNDFNFDACPSGKRRNLHGGTCGGCHGKPLAVDTIHHPEVSKVCQEDSCFDHGFKTESSCSQRSRNIFHNPFRLCGYPACHQFARSGVQCDLTRQKDKPTRLHPLRIGANSLWR